MDEGLEDHSDYVGEWLGNQEVKVIKTTAKLEAEKKRSDRDHAAHKAYLTKFKLLNNSTPKFVCIRQITAETTSQKSWK